MVHHIKILIPTIILTLACAATAHAGLGVGARFSYVRNNGIEDNSLMPGVMARIRSLMVLGLEGAVDFRKEELNNGSELRSTPITVSAMIYPIPVVYALAGVGFYRTTLDVAGEETTDNQIGYHVGAGIEAPLLPLLKLTGDVRFQHLVYDFDDVAESVGKFNADGYAISAGLILYLK